MHRDIYIYPSNKYIYNIIYIIVFPISTYILLYPLYHYIPINQRHVWFLGSYSPKSRGKPLGKPRVKPWVDIAKSHGPGGGPWKWPLMFIHVDQFWLFPSVYWGSWYVSIQKFGIEMNKNHQKPTMNHMVFPHTFSMHLGW